MNDSEIIYTSDRREILPYVPKVEGRILDIGCSSGNFSKLLKDEWGCEVHGIELNPKAAEIAAEKIDRVFCGDALAALAEVPDHYYDLVTMNDVLEHMVNPYEFLNELLNKIRTNRDYLRHCDQYSLSQGICENPVSKGI